MSTQLITTKRCKATVVWYQPFDFYGSRNSNWVQKFGLICSEFRAMKKGKGYLSSKEHADAINTVRLNADFIMYQTVALVL